MDNTMILISGQPGAGKSMFAGWVAEKLCLPVVSYNRLLCQIREISPDAAQGGELPYELFLFELEEHMGTAFIADYIFSVKQEAWLTELAARHNYPTVNVHFECSPKTAYARYIQRNAQEPGQRTRPEVPFDRYLEATAQNRDFLWGGYVLHIDAEDFSRVSYETVLRELVPLLRTGSTDQ